MCVLSYFIILSLYSKLCINVCVFGCYSAFISLLYFFSLYNFFMTGAIVVSRISNSKSDHRHHHFRSSRMLYQHFPLYYIIQYLTKWKKKKVAFFGKSSLAFSIITWEREERKKYMKWCDDMGGSNNQTSLYFLGYEFLMFALWEKMVI